MTQLAELVPLARQALTEPREAASRVLALGVPREALWPAFFALIAISTVLIYLATGVTPQAPGAVQPPPPFEMAALTAAFSAGSVYATWQIGRAMGGTGSFRNTLLVTVFLQAILLAGQVVEILIGLVFAPLGDILSIALLGLAVWLNVNFIDVLHGFGSRWKALGCLVLASLVVGLLSIVVLMLLGIKLTQVA